MGKNFQSLSTSEASVFLVSGSKRTGTHRMTERVLHWCYCANCGLLNLKNEATRRAMKKSCQWIED